MASISKRSDPKTGKLISYYLRWYENGKQHSQNLKTKNESKAKGILRDFETTKAAEKLGITNGNGYDKVRLDDAIDEFIAYKETRIDDKNLHRRLQLILADFRAAVGSNVYLDEINNRHLTPYIQILNKRGLGPGGKNTNLAYLRVFARWCFRNYRLQHPILYIDKEVMDQNIPKLSRHISDTEFAEICKHIEYAEVIAFARISKYLGLRLQEIVKATLKESGGVEYLSVYGKRNKQRVEPLLAWLKSDWNKVVEFRNRRGWGDPKRNSEIVIYNISRFISRKFTEASKASGVHTPCYNCDFPDWQKWAAGESCPQCGKTFHRQGNGKSFHGLRHHYVTFVSEKTDTGTAQDMTGHSSQRMTKLYIKSDEAVQVAKKIKVYENIYKNE